MAQIINDYFLIGLKEGTHAWYCKPTQESIVRELTGSGSKCVNLYIHAIILINIDSIKLPPKFISLCP